MSIFSDIGKAIGSVAPWIVKALPLPPPIGQLASTALASVLGTSDQSPEGLQAAIAGANPDQLIALRQKEQEFMLQMQAMGYKQITDLATIDAGDRASARAREISVRDWTPRILAYLVTAGFFGLLGFMLKYEIPVGNRDILFAMLGSLGTAWIAIVTYYFGSSSGSAAKSQTLDKVLSNGSR